MPYYILGCDGPCPTMPIQESDETSEIPSPWNDGESLSDVVREAIAGPITYFKARPTNPEEPQNLKALYKAEAIPLMRDDLVEALREAGVRNLELFPAVIVDRKTGEKATHYQAFNVVGLVACAAASGAKKKGAQAPRRRSADLDGLVIDEAKAGGALLFRVAECVSAIAVHESVKRKIEEKAIPGMVFFGPGEWSG